MGIIGPEGADAGAATTTLDHDGGAVRTLAAVTRWARRTPDAVSILEQGHAMTFADLLAYAEQGAAQLRRAGVGSGHVVAVRCSRRGPAIAGMLAAWSVGAAYLPLSASERPARVRRMLDVASPAAVFHDASDPVQPAVCTWAPGAAATPPEAAYVLFTSGSTGVPKGVVVGHAGLTGLVDWYTSLTGLVPGEAVGQVADIGFDASVMEIWGSLAAGATLVVPTLDEIVDPGMLQRFILDHRLAVCFVPTGLVPPLLDQPWPHPVPLRVLITGGDRLVLGASTDTLAFVLVNAYGPAECTVVAASEVVDLGRPRSAPVAPPIGRPLRHVRARVVDVDGRQCPPGVSGELWLGGPAVFLGYLGHGDGPGDGPQAGGDPSQRWYRTGDLVVQDGDGTLHFLARRDDQVQIGGRRTEPAEIAQAVHRFDEVTRAVVFTLRTPAGHQRLAVAVTPSSIGTAELQDFLESQLPTYMIPSEVLALDEIPVTPRGKVDLELLRRMLAERRGFDRTQWREPG